jgi:hypothetical protein
MMRSQQPFGLSLSKPLRVHFDKLSPNGGRHEVC